jgi:hypothetical protein
MITKPLNIMSNFIQNYEIILKHLQSLNISIDMFQQIRKPKLGNLELIAMNITAEYMGINSELQLFRDIKNSFLEGLIERSVYNRRKRNLFGQIEQIRSDLAKDFNEFEDVYVIDSMPLEICKNARASRSRICNDIDYALPSMGYCASQKNILFWV